MGDRQSQADRELADSLALMGAPAEVFAAHLPVREIFRLWPHHQSAWKAFMVVAHQWRLAPNGRPIGLDYPNAEAGWRLSGLTVSAADFEKIRLIESEILKLLSAEHEQ